MPGKMAGILFVMIISGVGVRVCVSQGTSDVFSSTVHLKDLVIGEQKMLQAFDQYLQKEELKLKYLKELFTKLQEDTAEVVNDPVSYIGHPLNAFNTIKRFHIVWTGLLNTIGTNLLYQEFHQTIVASGTPWTSELDYQGAIRAILRIQKVYNITVDSLVAGDIQQYKGMALDHTDCFEIGKVAISIGENKIAVEWLQRIIDDYPTESGHLNFTLSQVYLTIAQAYAAMSDLTNAIRHIETVALVLEPLNHEMKNLLWQYRKANESLTLQPVPQLPSEDPLRVSYEALCRGDPSHDETYLYPGYCHLRKTAIPYCPAKEEILRLDPYISIFHDVLTDTLANQLLQTASPQLFRATIGDPSIAVESDIRISKVAWLWDNDQHNIFIKTISERVAEITGLSTTYRDVLSDAEPFQVVNYGMGGQYEPHHDFYETRASLKNAPLHLQDTGDRIATFMFYLNDVKAGGATVFPNINIRVPPVKNGAAFWYNFKPSGQHEMDTQHAGCPVLLGEKWVANKWIREFGQMFRRKCKLSENSLETD